MERNEFLKSLGLGMALVCTGACFSGCGKSTETPGETPSTGGTTPPPTSNGVSIDLSNQIQAVGASVVVNNVLFIRTAAGNDPKSFVATRARCTHQGGPLSYLQSEGVIQCGLHAARFNLSGTTLSQPIGGGTAANIGTYPLTVTGNTLTATV